MFIADTLSRAYLNETVEDVPLNDDIEVMVHSFIQEIPASRRKVKTAERRNCQR